MLAVHMPEAALRTIESFAALEFDVCLRDISLPFDRDSPVAVQASRICAITDVSFGGAVNVTSSMPQLTGKLCQVISFCEPPMRLPLALASYQNGSCGSCTLPCLVDLSCFPPEQFAAKPPEYDDMMLLRALRAVLGGSWTPWPSSPRTLLAADTDICGIRLFWVKLPAAGSRLPAEITHTRLISLDAISFDMPPLPIMADREGKYVFIAHQNTRAVECIKACALTGNVVASSSTEGIELSTVVSLAPDLWLLLSDDEVTLLSATAPPRPQPALWHALKRARAIASISHVATSNCPHD